MVTWETYEAAMAFERSRKRAFVRLAKAALFRKSKGHPYSRIAAGEEFAVALDDIELLDIEGTTIPLPVLPQSQRARWIKEYNDFGRGEGFRKPFAARLEGGRLALVGGMPELRRLELLRALGDRRAAAKMANGPRPECDIIEYPERAGEARCSDRAAS